MSEEPTPRQLQVLRLIAEGYSDEDIARKLRRSPFTIRTHSNAVIHRITGGKRVTRAHAVAIAYDEGWLP